MYACFNSIHVLIICQKTKHHSLSSSRLSTAKKTSITVLADSRLQVTKQPRDKPKKKTKKKASFFKSPGTDKIPIWHHEWTSPKLLLTNGNYGIHEIVQGPFASPRLVRASPCVIRCPAGRKDADSKCYKIPGIRRGIPDPWNEYLALRGFCSEYDRKIAKRHLRLGCDSVRLTEAVWNDLGLTLSQGIPDPWKDCPYEIKNLVEKKTSRSRRNKSRIKLRGFSRDPVDFPEPLKKLNDKVAKTKTEKMSTFSTVDTKIQEKGEVIEKKVYSENPQTVLFDSTIVENSSKRLEHNKIGKKRPKCFRDEQNRCRVVNVRRCYQPNRLSCEINEQPRKSRLSKEISLEKKNNEVFSGRSRVLEENVKNRVIKVRQNEEKLSYPCRVCQPEVTPTRCLRAARVGQENFWRCTRHQPGASYHLEASQVSRRRRLAHDNGESLITVEPEMNGGPWNSSSFSNEKTVPGLMKRLMGSWKNKNSDNQNEKFHWYVGKDEINPHVNFVCCQCSCPYLRTSSFLDYDDYNFDNGSRRQLCKKCICTKCLNRREQKIKERNTRNCSKHGKKGKNESKPETEYSGGREDPQMLEDPHNEPSTKIPSKGRPEVPEEFPQVQTTLKEDKYDGKHFFGESLGKMAERESQLSAEVVEFQIREFLRSGSSDSGARADISNASRRTNATKEAASVTSSTFINLIREKPNQMALNKNCDFRNNSRILVASSHRDGRRGKRRYLVKRSSDENFRSCRCVHQCGNSGFQRIEDSVVEQQKHVTYEAKGSPRIEDNTMESAAENFKSDEESSNLEVMVINKESLERNEDRKEGGNFSNNSRESSRSCADKVENVRRTFSAREKNLKLQNASSDRSNIQKAVRKRRVTNVTAEGISSVKLPQLQSTNLRMKSSDSVKIQSNVEPDLMSGSRSSRKFETRETDMIGVKLFPGPCIRERSLIGKPQATDRESYGVIERSETHPGNGDWNDKEESNDPSNEIVKPFEREISDTNADTDDPGIEFLEIQEKMSLKKQNVRQDAIVSVMRSTTTKTGFFESGINDPKCYVKSCAERKSSKARFDEELLVQSYSETEDLEKEIKSVMIFSSK